jgi:superfamily I DNA/RNA helicase
VITRARHRLTLSGCATRRERGDSIPRQRSRFLKEVPPDLLEYRTGKKSSLSEEDGRELKANFFSKMKEMLK